LNNLNEEKKELIEELQRTIVNHTVNQIGKNGIISIILTGSMARGGGQFKQVNNRLVLESDFDVLVVVEKNTLLKSLVAIKKLSRKLTFIIRKKSSKSYVTLSVTTRDSLINSDPSIFHQDLNLNGKIIFGKDIIKLLKNHEPNSIPNIDLYKLLFNRMAESLKLLVESKLLENEVKEFNFELFVHSLEKLSFSLIQSLLIRNNIIIFRGSKLEIFRFYEVKQTDKPLFQSLLEFYEEIEMLRKSNTKDSRKLEEYWLRLITLFNLSITNLSNEKNISTEFLKQILRIRSLKDRTKTSLATFMQYYSLSNLGDLFRTLFHLMFFGDGFVYISLYKLFMETENLIKLPKNSQNYEKNKSLTHHPKVPDAWLKSFKKYYMMWSIQSGL